MTPPLPISSVNHNGCRSQLATPWTSRQFLAERHRRQRHKASQSFQLTALACSWTVGGTRRTHTDTSENMQIWNLGIKHTTFLLQGDNANRCTHQLSQSRLGNKSAQLSVARWTEVICTRLDAKLSLRGSDIQKKATTLTEGSDLPPDSEEAKGIYLQR